MRQRQQGVTFIGWLFLLLPIVIVLYAIMRLAPVYLNYMKLTRSMQQTADSFKGDSTINAQAVKVALQKHFEVESLDYPKVADISVKRVEGVWTLEADYEDVAPLFAGISLLVKFDKVATVAGIGAGAAN